MPGFLCAAAFFAIPSHESRRGHHKQQQSKFSPLFFFFFPQFWAGGKGNLGTALDQLLNWGIKREVWCCVLLVLQEPIPPPKAFWDVYPPVITARPVMAWLFLPQLSSKLPPTLPNLKQRWFRELVSSPLPCLICIYLHSTQVSERGGGAGEAHPLFFFFFPLSAELYLFV